MKSFYKVMGILIGCYAFLSFGVFADYLQTSISNQLLTTTAQCNGGTFPMVYYVGSSAITISDTFQSDSPRLWKFIGASNVTVYNPSNILQFSQPIAQAFPFYSNGKPANVNSVVITATPISISSTIPADYSRNTVAAQLVYEIHRYERGFTAASNGKFSVTYLAEGASSSQKFLYNNADPILPTVSDKECRNIYVGFCGDGVIDNTNIKSSTNIRAALAGGEECDPNHPDYIGKGTCSQDCKKITPPSTATGVITKVLVSPQYVTTTGEQVTWRITLTASGGNLNLANHTIKEKLPAELEYVSYTVTTPNGVTVNAPTIAGNIITWALNGTLAQNNSIVINLATKVKQMPPAGNTVRNVACFAKNTWEELSCDNPPINPSCNSSYHGQEVENLTSGDYLCNFGTISNFTPTTSGGIVTWWTWKCNGVSGTSPAQCSATKPSPETPGTGTIDKTLISPQYVTKIGEQVTWKIVVTARNGAISNFTITDKLPAELELAPFPYYTVLVSNGVTVNTPTVNGNTITWTTSGSLAKDKTIEIELRTKVKSMPKDTVRNVACLKIGNNPELCDNPPINPSCNSSYHGQEVESLTSGDYLCNFGTISNFTPTTSGGIVTWRTWKCNGEAGTSPAQCSANKKGTEPSPKLWITKRFLDGSTRPTYKIGDTVEYRIDFGNNGNAPATVVSLRDFVPQNLTGISSILYRTDSNSTHFDEIIEGGYVDVYGEITLPAGSQGYFILKGTITATHQDERTNKACIYLNNKEINCARVIYDLETLQSHLRIYKKVDKTEVNVGDIVIFTLEIRNDGQTPMTDFTVADKLPEYVSYVEGSQRGGENFFEFVVDSEARLLVRSNYSATLQPNEFIILTFRAKVESIGRHTNWVCLVHEDLFPSANFGPSENCDPADVVAKETPYCGDGIRNNGERCDYKDPTKSGRGTDGCDTSCNPINDDRPYCGNGVIDSKLKETCECPKGRISCQGRDVIFPDGHRDNNASCTYCHIPNQTTPIACFDVGNGSISINEGEMLPFYRNIEKVDEDSYTELGVDVENVIDTYDRYKKGNQSCNSANEGKIALDAMVCTFRVYNGENIQSDDDYVYELRVPCFTKGSDIQRDRQSSSLISKWIDWNKHNFIKGGNDNGGNTFRSYNILNNNRGFAFRSSVFVINNFGRTSGGSAGRFVDYGEWQQKSERIDVYGEYKLSLHEVNYLQCNNGYRKEQDPYNRVCDVNFSVTKPYIIQKTPAGNVENIKINNTTVDLSKFLMYADGTSTNFSAQLGKVISTGGVYNPTKDVEKALTGFINKYSKLAVALDKNTKLFGNDLGVKVKKVPGKDIYFVEGNLNIDGFRFTYETSKTKIDEVHGTNSVYDRPFTIVQTVGNTTIKGNLNHNMMLLTNGTITFDGSKNCNDTQVVKGIFYSSAIQWFVSTGVSINNNLENPDRCIGGNLHIKGIVIGKGLDNVAANRRSELNQWFRSRASQNQSATDRRNYIMNGAAVLIEYAPSVFTKSTMPPGAEEFTTALSVYRK